MPPQSRGQGDSNKETRNYPPLCHTPQITQIFRTQRQKKVQKERGSIRLQEGTRPKQ